MPDKQAREGTAEKDTLEDEMIPKGGEQVSKTSKEGDVRDTAGRHGRMAPESARGLEDEKD